MSKRKTEAEKVAALVDAGVSDEPAGAPESDEPAVDGQEDPAPQDSAVPDAVADIEPGAVSAPEPMSTEEIVASMRAAAAAADEGDEAARHALDEWAAARDIDPLKYSTWTELVEAMIPGEEEAAADPDAAAIAIDEETGEPTFVSPVAIDPIDQRRADDLQAWIAANPDATFIPPSLLPPRYQDGTVITPGLPATLLG